MKIFKVEYNGSYLGGLAFVVAEDEQDAILRVMYDPKTKNFNDIKVTQLNYSDGHPGPVFHNDIGDY